MTPQEARAAWTFRGKWLIRDQTAPFWMLKVEGAALIDALAKETRCRIVGDIRWYLEDGYLVGEAPAKRTDCGEVDAGTYAGSHRHARLGEELCDRCREARNEYAREQRKKRRDDAA